MRHGLNFIGFQLLPIIEPQALIFLGGMLIIIALQLLALASVC